IVEADAMESKESAVERGIGNVFADLGFPDADAHLVKAELVSRIDDIVRDRGITQTEAARLLGLSQPDVSRLLRGDFREYSLERLFRLLTALGRDIDIVVRQPRPAAGGRLRIAAAEPA
ncbi:MAG: helix-turn-helix transcriptional regulator, partial [Rhodobacter sp.]|nr:helix-turn-helix transcriptional regulator [Rhodobacter sp.]